jgi:hypothetical protein
MVTMNILSSQSSEDGDSICTFLQNNDIYHIYQIYDQHFFPRNSACDTWGVIIVHKIKHVVHMYFPEKLSTVKVDRWRGRRVGPNMQGLILG